MPTRRTDSEPRVLPIIRRIRNRWRLRVALKGSAIVLGAGFAAFLLSAYGLELLRFSPEAVTALRVATWGAVAVLAGLFLIRPLSRRIDDERVALYLEEHEPSLEAAILGAVQVEREGGAGATASPELLRRLVDRAVERAKAVEFGSRIEQRGLYRASGGLAAVTVLVLLFLFLGPADLRYGMNALFFPTTDAAEVNPYSIAVTPGDVTIARGSDQLVTARLEGFASDEVYVFSRSGGAGTYQRLSMLTGSEGGFELLLLNLQEETDYFVESNGIRSATHTIEVAELPYVDWMDLTYRFPAYTGLEPRVVEDGGDVAALAGTEVELVVHSTIPTGGGRLLVDDQPVMELEAGPEGTLLGRFTVDEPGVYEIELARADGQMVSASPEYTIDVLSDLPPSVAISAPGRDTRASAIEEVWVEARADDDYGVRDVRLVYSVNGGPEDTLAIFDGSGPPLTEVSASHTFFLEEWELEPGDVVSYYAVARDNRQAGTREVVSDIYFVNVRPFGVEYREAEQMGGGGAAAGAAGAGAESALSELQRQVVSATFNVLRDQESYTPTQYQENLVSVALAQGRVREQVATLVQRMNNRGLSDAEPGFREIAELLPEALEDMESAEELLRDSEPRAALAPEQRALRVLQKAEESYERMVQQQQGGGGGGGGGGANAEDLADLFELEMDKLQNQYETVQRGERQQADQEVDELMEKLDELARRQQQEMERQRRQAANRQGAQGGSAGQSQRELAEEAEEAARQLERLARESGDAELQETARRLREAAESMRRSAANAGRSQGAADAGSALDDLEEAQRRLERTREDRMRESARDAMERVNRLAESQRQVQDQLDRLSEDPAERAEGVRRIIERKDEMVRETEDLERQIERMADDARRDDPQAARELDEAAGVIRDTKLKEAIAWTRGTVQERNDEEIARQYEEQIAAAIEELRRQMAEAARAAEEIADDRGLEEALEETRDLVRDTESLTRRLENRGRQEGQGEQGQEAEQGQGQEGQGQEGQGQEGEGQEGQGQQGRAGAGGSDPDSTGAGGEGRRLQRGGEQGQGQGQQSSDQAGARGAGGEGDPSARPGGGRLPSGEPGYRGGATGGVPEPFTEEEIRQYQRDFEERMEQARELRRTLAEDGRDVSDLDEAIAVMDQLRDRESYEDLPNIPVLQERLRQSLKRLEFTLRREVEGEGAGRAFLSGSDEVPTGFRELVEEYYRSLARSSGDGGGGGG